MNTPEARIQDLLDRYAAGGSCLAALLCDDHPSDLIAFTVVEPDLRSVDLTHGELKDRSQRLAAALAALDVGPGDCVGVLMGKSVDLVVALLALWRLGAVHVPLFTAFAPPAIALRLQASNARLVIVDADQRSKLEPSADLPANPALQIVTVGQSRTSSDLNFSDLLLTEPDEGRQAHVSGADDPFVMIFTSGTTGAPKGVPIPVRAVAACVAYLEFGCDVRGDDVYWNCADPGWGYGLFFAIVAPMASGRRSVLVHSGFSADLTWRVLAELGVTNFAAAPTVYRALRGLTAPDGLVLRCASSAGEPLTPDLIPWAERTLGITIRDHYGQTELGMVIANGWHPSVCDPVRPGSMGRALPGWTVEILCEDRDLPAPDGVVGRVAVDRHASTLMAFPGYHNAPERTAERLTPDGRWYLTGDVALRDPDGYIHFASRDDDVIIMAGYRIGPFDIESVLLGHPDVIEAAVVGVPDALRGEVIEAFVVLRDAALECDELTQSLQQRVKTGFAAHAYPRAVHYVPSLPKTPSGKIQRFVLRKARTADLDEKAAL